MAHELVVDFSDAESFTPPPPGFHDVIVDSVKVGKSQAGNAKLTLVLKVGPGEFEGRTLIDDLVLEGHPLALGRTRDALKTLLGVEIAGEFRLNTDDLIGVAARVRITHEVWTIESGGDGSVRARVRAYVPAGGELTEMFAEDDELL